MRQFMDGDFLLHTKTAKTLYHDHAANMPIIDYHCHINPAEVMQDRRFGNIADAWLGGDHYKWRQMRTMGVAEKFITGDAPGREKFQKFAEILPYCVGNHVHHWSHLELRRYFDCDLTINGENAQKIWDHTEKLLQSEGFSVRGIIERSRVKAISTTDDPADDLTWHKQLKADPTTKFLVTPTLRPDKAVNIDKPGFVQYIENLAGVSGVNISGLDDLKAALIKRIDFFHEVGCRISDHGLDYLAYRVADAKTVGEIFAKGLVGQAVSEAEAEIFKTDMMLFFGREFAGRNWAMQLHYGALRNNNQPMFEKVGPDTGFDAISSRECSEGIARFLGALAREDKLPKTVLYSLNPSDNAMLVSLAACFSGEGIRGKVQHGSAWWFNDTRRGMENQMLQLAEISVLGTFVGMLTDSRSFLSYTRHEYFRRILCNILGNLVEGGEYPADMKLLGQLVEDISYNNAKNFFGYNL